MGLKLRNMSKEKKHQADKLDAWLEKFEADRLADERKQDRKDLKKALKQLVLHMCWSQQIAKGKLSNSIPFYICSFVERYANGDKALLQEMINFFEEDCRKGERPICLGSFRPSIGRVETRLGLIITEEKLVFKDEAEKKKTKGEVNAAERI